MKKKLYFVTGNKNKLEEARKIIPGIESMNLDLPEIQDIDPRKVIEAKLKKAGKNRRQGKIKDR